MNETTEEIIARLAKDRAKTILENGDYWSSPGAAKTSAEAITTLIAVNPPVTLAKANAVAAAIEEVPKPKRQPKESPAPAPVTPDESDPADV